VFQDRHAVLEIEIEEELFGDFDLEKFARVPCNLRFGNFFEQIEMFCELWGAEVIMEYL